MAITTTSPKSLLPIHPAQFLGKIKASEVKNAIEAMWNHDYPACPVLEPECVGLTYGQVAIMRQVKLAASGDSGAFERMLDRIVGKAMQVNKNLNVNKSYADFCKEVAIEEGIIDAESLPGGSSDPDGPSTLQ